MVGKVSISKFNEFIASKGALKACDACDKHEWTFLEIAEGEPSVAIQNSSTGMLISHPHIPTVVLVCGNCGNMRFHAKRLIEKFLRDRTIEELS